MFKVTFMCEDHKLGKALMGLTGLIAEPPSVLPVANAQIQSGRVHQKVPGVNLTEMVRNYLSDSKLKQVSAADLRLYITKLGYHPSNAHGVSYRLRKEKLLKSIGRGIYEVRPN